jgi:sporulation protein YlmC with PRC-barrel domain
MRMSELKRREVINVCDCKRLGFVGDLDVDPCTGRILAIIGTGLCLRFPGTGKRICDPLWGYLSDRRRYYSGPG